MRIVNASLTIEETLMKENNVETGAKKETGILDCTDYSKRS